MIQPEPHYVRGSLARACEDMPSIDGMKIRVQLRQVLTHPISENSQKSEAVSAAPPKSEEQPFNWPYAGPFSRMEEFVHEETVVISWQEKIFSPLERLLYLNIEDPVAFEVCPPLGRYASELQQLQIAEEKGFAPLPEHFPPKCVYTYTDTDIRHTLPFLMHQAQRVAPRMQPMPSALLAALIESRTPLEPIVDSETKMSFFIMAQLGESKFVGDDVVLCRLCFYPNRKALVMEPDLCVGSWFRCLSPRGRVFEFRVSEVLEEGTSALASRPSTRLPPTGGCGGSASKTASTLAAGGTKGCELAIAPLSLNAITPSLTVSAKICIISVGPPKPVQKEEIFAKDSLFLPALYRSVSLMRRVWDWLVPKALYVSYEVTPPPGEWYVSSTAETSPVFRDSPSLKGFTPMSIGGMGDGHAVFSQGIEATFRGLPVYPVERDPPQSPPCARVYLEIFRQVQVSEVGVSGRRSVVGYGYADIPLVGGDYSLSVPLWRPCESFINKFKRLCGGEKPALCEAAHVAIQPKAETRLGERMARLQGGSTPLNRSTTQTQSAGVSVHLSMSIARQSG